MIEVPPAVKVYIQNLTREAMDHCNELELSWEVFFTEMKVQHGKVLGDAEELFNRTFEVLGYGRMS